MKPPKQIINKRIKHLKELKQIANSFLLENIKLKNNQKRSWEYDVIENNIKQLRNIISKANRELGDKELQKFALNQNIQFAYLKAALKPELETGEDIQDYMTRMMEGIERFEIFTYSPSFSIVYDLYWIPDGTIGEQHDVAIGKQPPDIYEKYCEIRLHVIEQEVIPYLIKNPSYKKHVELLREVTASFNRNSFLLSNILLVTVTESIVRELCKFVYIMQNPNLKREEITNEIYSRYSSLESLVIKASWKEDMPISVTTARAESRFIVEPSLNKSVVMMENHQLAEKQIEEETAAMTKLLLEVQAGIRENNDQLKSDLQKHLKKIEHYGKDLLTKEQKILVTIRSRLQFLLRRYKEDRNSIIHGNYFDFDKGWKSYIYLSAITKVFEIIKDYDRIYK